MLANDCLRRIRYILDIDDSGMIGVFAEAGRTVSRAQISAYLKKEDDEGYEECSDLLFATFLNGLINQKRGKQDGKSPKPEKRLSNNIIFRKLKIAFNLQADEILSTHLSGRLSGSATVREHDVAEDDQKQDQAVRDELRPHANDALILA